MNAVSYNGDLNKSHFYHDGDVMVAGNFSIDGPVAINGTLIVFKNIFIGGDCEVKEIQCSGTIDIAGFLDCDRIRCSSSIKVGYDIN